MLTQRIAFVFGLAFLFVAALGFMATGVVMPDMNDSMASVPKILGLFPVNVAHNLVHLTFGVWGLWAARTTRGAFLFAMISGAIYFVLAGVGLYMPDGMGVVPIGGYDVVLHAAIAAVLVGVALFDSLRTAPAPAQAPARRA